jgi:hypothetical protein
MVTRVFARRALQLLPCAFLAIACAESTPPPKPAPTTGSSTTASPPRFDGVYQSKVHGSDGADLGWDYLRFLSDGNVLSVSSPAPIEKAAGLLFAPDERTATGTVEIRGGVLRFVMKSKLGSVEYQGVVQNDELHVRWHSLINGATAEETFTFVPVEEQAEEPPAAELPPPAVEFLPAGSGWFCMRITDSGASRCERSLAECDSLRKQVSAAVPTAKPTKCVRQKKAYCHTLSAKATKEGTAICYRTSEDCMNGLDGFRSAGNSSEYALSTCDEE